MDINGVQDFHSLIGYVGGVISLTLEGNELIKQEQFKSIHAVYADFNLYQLTDYINEYGSWKDLKNSTSVKLFPASVEKCEKINN